ncbi:MAG TPA: hypothetical protein VN813_07305, partial [Luteibacter sp.]|nr:hypothetical protein [Luteibacter sp.]
DEAALLASAADAPPPQGGQASAETARCVLEPGRLYRIDVRMRWSGILSTYDETGKKVELVRKEGLPEMESERHYWFRTAKLRPTPSSPVALSTLNWANFVQVRRDLFDPDMLQRYLRGYEPAQSELHRFQDDPVRAHFSVSHVDALAYVYGFQLLCEIRRLDAPLHDDDPQILGGVKWTDNLKLVKDPGEVTIAQAYLDSPCKMPLPGVMVEASPVLLAQCWYEVRVLAKSLDPDKVKDGRLAGVTFRTSRWANGRDMLDGMGFHDVGLDFLRPDGDIDISGRTWPAGAVLGDDAMFEAALIALGMEGWPPAVTPRTSVLWTHTGSDWRCAGLLVESPEPIHRPGRFEIGGLSSRMGRAVRPFEIVRWDRSGSRLLFLTANAVIPVSTRGPVFGRPVPPLFQLDAFDHPFIGPPAPRMGYLRMPGRPAFAEEAP